MYIKPLANILSFIQTVWCITQNNSEQRTHHFPPMSNCQFSFWFALDPTFGIKTAAASQEQRVKLFSSAPSQITKLLDSFIYIKKGNGRRFQSAAQSSVCFTTEFCCSALPPCPISHSVICLLLGVSQVSSPRPKSRVSLTFSQYLVFVDHSRGEDAEVHW